jgi:signal peptidase II
MRNPPLLWGLLVAMLVALADQMSKKALLGLMASATGPLTLTPFFNLVMVWNRGVSFGMFREADARLGLIVFTALVIIGLLFWLARARGKLLPLALGLVMGGAFGNLLDRIIYGAVADFFDVHAFGYHWPAFNVADAAICTGVALLLWQSWREESPRRV